MKKKMNIWSFPDIIDFEMAPILMKQIEEYQGAAILFDLSNTKTIHSSFIGLLIHAKKMLESGGADFFLKTSPDIDKLFGMLNLGDYFSRPPTDPAQEYSATRH